MAMLLLLAGFIGLWAVTEIIENMLSKRQNHRQTKYLRWID